MRVRVLTNSLASTDAPAAHAGYARHRPGLLAMGVELHELRAGPSVIATAFARGSGALAGIYRIVANKPDPSTFYGAPNPKGYTDYPTFAAKARAA